MSNRWILAGQLVAIVLWMSAANLALGDDPSSEDVRKMLTTFCSHCHSGGTSEGGFSFDPLTALQGPEKGETSEEERQKWFSVLKKVQSRSMPPPEEDQPDPTQVADLGKWIKYSVFGIVPENPDPGHVTMRRLNQVEYRNSVRDLLGVDYDTNANFPADDTGHGFDNIGEVLSLSPLLLEKYVNAAEEIVSSVVPMVSGVVRQNSLTGDQFRLTTDDSESKQDASGNPNQSGRANSTIGNVGGRRDAPRHLELSYYQPATARAVFPVELTGDYTLRIHYSANETYVDNQFDENKCEFSLSMDGKILFTETMVRQGARDYQFNFDTPLTSGDHELVATLKPLTDRPQIRRLRLQIKLVEWIGPREEKYFVKPEGYEKFFPREVPKEDAERRIYARELLEGFASRAFRRPVDDESLNRLVSLAESVYTHGASFEAGIAKSMTAVLASPRFLFREESIDVGSKDVYPYIDEYALASRLSYFLWSSMPDSELIELAGKGQLRRNLDLQVARMLSDRRSRLLSENFVGQWLRARAVEHIQINSAAVLAREPSRLDPESDLRRRRFFELFRLGPLRNDRENDEYAREKEKFLASFGATARAELTPEVRSAMRRETEMLFDHIVKNNRSLLELIDCDYTFLNEPLWGHYQLEGVEKVLGSEMQFVKLPAGSHRGGVLTQGTTLVVTSNPDRTSPVKRGLFILENLLGTPPAAPPPNIPALEDVASEKDKPLSLRETLALHRSNALCSSCHNQMDPLGLALENFNALGNYRTQEWNQPIDAAGRLTSGEPFQSIDDLKRILVNHHQEEIYRCISEKMMTYALGRAVEYGDSHTLDDLVEKLRAENGSAQTLIYGIIHSNAFQRSRRAQPLAINQETKR